MNARAQTIVHVSLEMTQEERDELVKWLSVMRDAAVDERSELADLLISILKATETEKQLPISS